MKLSIVLYALLSLVPTFAPTALKAQTNPKLVFTETSSTSLTVTLDGNPFGTVDNVGPDHWVWRSGVFGSGVVQDNSFHNGFWAEPGAESGVNLLNVKFFEFIPGSTILAYTGFDIQSDLPSSAATAIPAPNGSFGFNWAVFDATSPFPSTPVFGPVDVYFNDSTDVPDIAQTLGLLLLSTGAMFGIVWLRTATRKESMT